MAEFRMPALGADMEYGTLIEWKMKPGDTVARGQVVALVETDKGNIDVQIWEPGVVEELRVAPGARVPVGAVLATLHDGAARAPAEPVTAPPPVAAAPPAPPTPVPAPFVPSAPPVPSGTPAAGAPAEAAPTPTARVRASPAARRRALERGVDLATVRGTGPGGAITLEDVDHAAARPPRTDEERAAAMRRAIAAAMGRSKREIPHYYVATEIDASRLLRWLEAENAKLPLADRMLYAAPLVKAVALALREFGELNGYFVDGAFRPGAAIHVGFAISLRRGGLVAPALHDADRRTPVELMRMLSDLIGRVRAGSIRSSEISDPTVTVTSLGERGVETVFGVIYPPQVALIGFGAIRERPFAEGGMLGVRPVLTATLAADHRVSDGHRGALFLARLGALLQEPEKLR